MVVLQNDKGNKSSPTIIVSPLTTASKAGRLPTHVRVWSNEIKNQHMRMFDSTLLLEHIYTVNISDLTSYVGKIDLTKDKYKKALEVSLGLT